MQNSELCVFQGVHEEIEIKTGSAVKVTPDEAFKEAVEEQTIWVDYKNIVNVLEVGKHLYIDDGLIDMVVKDRGKIALQGNAVNGAQSKLLTLKRIDPLCQIALHFYFCEYFRHVFGFCRRGPSAV